MSQLETYRLSTIIGDSGELAKNAYSAGAEMYESLLFLSSATFVTNHVVGNYAETHPHEILQGIHKALQLQQEEWKELSQEIKHLSNKSVPEMKTHLSAVVQEWADIQVYQFHMLNQLLMLSKVFGDALEVPDSISAVARNNMKKIFTNKDAAKAVQEQYESINVPTRVLTKQLTPYSAENSVYMVVVDHDCYSSAGRYYPANKFLKPLKQPTEATA